MTDTSITYAGYLGLDRLLSAQHPTSDRHDELLFIIIHQTKELWLKEIIHEVKLAKGLIRGGDVEPAYKALARVSRIQTIMTLSWDVLATMTPADYLTFRGGLGTSSGFQSWQFRTVEYLLGLKDASFLAFQEEGSAALAELKAALEAPSLYDDALLTWRHKHVLTVERIIGGKRGTGGTEGASYLQRTLQRRCFPELWSLRTRL